jgi:alpha-galactosidase
MANAEKIAIIGAGSAQFSVDVVRDIAMTPDLKGSEVVFMDIDPTRLSMIAAIAKRYNDEVASGLHFRATSDRREAIEDARFIVNMALAGGHQLMEDERNIHQQNGYYHGIAVHAPYRQLRLMHNIAEDVEQYGKSGAYIFQSANPLTEGCTIMTRETDVNVVGLCNGFLEYEKILDAVELPKKDIIYEAPGINHSIWMTKLQVNGKDVYPDIDKWIAEKSKKCWENWSPEFDEMQLSPAAIDLYKLYGLMPIGDTVRASWPEAWWYHSNAETKKKWWGPCGGHDGEEGWKQHLEWLAKRQKQIVTAIENPKIPLVTIFPAIKSREQIVPIIDAIVNDKPNTFQVNVPNNGTIYGLPDDFVVEIPVIIDSKGIHRQKIGCLPDSVMFGVLYPRWIFAERIISAYKTGDIRFMLQVYLSDHRTQSREQAEKTIDDTISMKGNEEYAHKIAQFREEKKE